jgi:hypothetical protein
MTDDVNELLNAIARRLDAMQPYLDGVLSPSADFLSTVSEAPAAGK